EDLPENVAEDVAEAAEALEPAEASLPEGAALVAEAIVAAALLRVGEAGIGLGGLLELLLRLGVPRVLVGVILKRELAVRALDLGGGRGPIDAQDFVVVALQVPSTLSAPSTPQ